MTSNRSSQALARAEWQPILFGRGGRAALLSLIPDWPCQRIPVRVYRNHGFEAVAAAVPPYAAWNLLDFQFDIGAYDDSLSVELSAPCDVAIVWLDTTRLSKLTADELGEWFA